MTIVACPIGGKAGRKMWSPKAEKKPVGWSWPWSLTEQRSISYLMSLEWKEEGWKDNAHWNDQSWLLHINKSFPNLHNGDDDIWTQHNRIHRSIYEQVWECKCLVLTFVITSHHSYSGKQELFVSWWLHRLWKRFVYVHITILCIFSISSFLKWSLKKEKKEQFLLWSEDITTASCGLHKWTGTVHCREIDARETYKQQVWNQTDFVP